MREHGDAQITFGLCASPNSAMAIPEPRWGRFQEHDRCYLEAALN
jgi:hypothetical protein